MDGDAGAAQFPDDEPRLAGRPRPLTARERRTVVIVVAAPLVVALGALLVVGAPFGAGVGEVLVATVVYGGLTALAAGFVAVDRLQDRQCPACGERAGRTVATCPGCGYDRAGRPRFRCDEGHGPYLDPGVCGCGRRLKPAAPARGVGREVVAMLRIGAWLLAVLVGIGLVLRVLESIG